MKVGDLVTDPGHNTPGYGVVLNVRECVIQGEVTGALSVETYWPELEASGRDPIKRNNTREPWFRMELVQAKQVEK